MQKQLAMYVKKLFAKFDVFLFCKVIPCYLQSFCPIL